MDIKDEITSDWNGFESIEFKFEGRDAVVVFPKAPCEGKKWLIKTEYFGAYPDFEIHMIERGYHLAYVANGSRFMLPGDVEIKARFADYLAERFGFNRKCFPVGMSCGGLHAVYFAAQYPEYVAAMYIDAPVMNLLSCPLALGRERYFAEDELERETGITLSELLNYRNHPIDKKEYLLKAGIPILMVSGDSDTIVPYNENGKQLTDYYRANGGTIVEIIKPGAGHVPHGLSDDSPIIDFAEKYYK